MSGLALIFADEQCAAELTDEKLLAAMARFEAALALAGAQANLVPAEDAAIIARVCETARFDAGALAQAARGDGALTIPFVKALIAQVAAVSPAASRHVHAGATSQDAMDTAMVLCIRPVSHRIEQLVVKLGDAAAAIARAHASTPMPGRTLLQPALPVPFGWKAAVWLSMLARSLGRFRNAAGGVCVLQFGGASGTLSAFGASAASVEAALAKTLSLEIPAAPWHSARDALASFGAESAILAGTAGKIARDVSLLMQPEIGEAAEAAPGGSSSMPHKRNPSRSLLALEASQRAPGLAATLLTQLTSEHERGIGQWQSQWFTVRDLLCATSSALAAMGEVLESLQVNPAAMRANLERSGIPAAELKKISGPLAFGAAPGMIERVLDHWGKARVT